jgi:hypothetical protein
MGTQGMEAQIEIDFAQVLPHRFFRIPSWRWYRASWLVQHGKHLDSRIDDDWVSQAMHFQIAAENASGHILAAA